MKAVARRRRNAAKYAQRLLNDDLQGKEVALRNAAARVRARFAGKLHPQRRRPLHALRGRALRRRVEWRREDAQRTEEGAAEDYARDWASFERAKLRVLYLCTHTPRQIRSAARARRFACADKGSS